MKLDRCNLQLCAIRPQLSVPKNPRETSLPFSQPMATPPPLAVEVRCAGCGETLEVENGTTDFACPDCGTAQRLPPELMPQPPRPRRAIPLPAAAGRAAAAAQDRVPCGCSGALITAPPGLGGFACPICGVAGRRPQGSAPATGVPMAQPLPPEPQVLRIIAGAFP